MQKSAQFNPIPLGWNLKIENDLSDYINDIWFATALGLVYKRARLQRHSFVANKILPSKYFRSLISMPKKTSVVTSTDYNKQFPILLFTCCKRYPVYLHYKQRQEQPHVKKYSRLWLWELYSTTCIGTLRSVPTLLNPTRPARCLLYPGSCLVHLGRQSLACGVRPADIQSNPTLRTPRKTCGESLSTVNKIQMPLFPETNYFDTLFLMVFLSFSVCRSF